MDDAGAPAPMTTATDPTDEPRTVPDASPTRRRFTLLDLMILIAGLAPGLVVAQEIARGDAVSVPDAAPPVLLAPFRYVAYVVLLLTPAATSLTPALLLLRGLGGHRWRGPTGRPTTGTALLATVALLGVVGWPAIWGIYYIVDGGPSSYAIPAAAALFPLLAAGGTVGVRLGAAMFGIRDRSSDWIDRLALASCWFWWLAAPLAFSAILR